MKVPSCSASEEKMGTTTIREEDRNRRLEWRDYVALTIAALETILLPFVIFVLILIVIFLVAR